MANQKISAMTAASALTGAEQIAAVQSGANVKLTPAQIRTFIAALVADGKTLIVSNTITFVGTDGTTMTLPATSQTIPGLSQANTFSGALTMSNAAVSMTALPTADPHVVGRLWANAGVLTVSAG